MSLKGLQYECFLVLLNGQRVSGYGQVIARLIKPVTQPSPCVKVNKAIFCIAVSVIHEGHRQEKILLMFGSFMLANEIAPPSLEDETTWKDFIPCRLRSALFSKVKCAIKIVSPSVV